MTTFYFPQNIFNNILEYCDDRIERKVKHHRQYLHKELDKFDPDWVSSYIDYNEDFGNTTGEIANHVNCLFSQRKNIQTQTIHPTYTTTTVCRQGSDNVKYFSITTTSVKKSSALNKLKHLH